MVSKRLFTQCCLPLMGLLSCFAIAFGSTSDPIFSDRFENRIQVFPRITSSAQEPLVRGEDAAAAAIYSSHAAVVLSSGEARLQRTDLFVPGRGQLHFRFERVYRSRIDYDGPLGFGWDHNYNERLLVQDNGNVARSNGRGHVDIWVRNLDASYQSPAGFFGTLVQESDNSFVLREPDGFKRFFDTRGRLTRHSDRHGNDMLFNYDGLGNLTTISDAFGRVYQLTYENLASRQRLVSLIDFHGREVRFDFDTAGDLIAVTSPTVTGTSHGNDFPQGRTESYTYQTGPASDELSHNLLTVTYPVEVQAAGPAAISFAYGTSGYANDRVISLQAGGTNASGIAAGGTANFTYTPMNEGVALGDPSVVRLEVMVVDRNGTSAAYRINERDHLIEHWAFTAGLRPDDPGDYFASRYEYDADGQVTRIIHPEGNETLLTYDSGGPRAAQANLLEQRLKADALRGGGPDLVTTMTYEPVFNQVQTTTDPRGNAIAFTPPLGNASAARYSEHYFFDYQEGNGPIEDAIKYGIDLTGINRNLGDLNQDGQTNQVSGNVVRKEHPGVLLRADSRLAIATGSSNQDIVEEFQWNDRGQQLSRIDPEGNREVSDYYPENDPDGDGSVVEGEESTVARGYLKSVTQDSSDVSNRRSALSPPADLTTRFAYDAIGNVISRLSPRGIVTAFEYNPLREVLVETRGSDVDEAVDRGELLTGESAFSYRRRYHYDANGRLILMETEDRASVSATEGVGDWVEREFEYDILDNLLATTVEVNATDSAATGIRYDGNDLPTELIRPEGNRLVVQYDERNMLFRLTLGASTTEAATTQIDYDLNGNRVREIDAEDNDSEPGPETTVYAYDGFDRLQTITDPLGNVTTRSYDPASNVIRSQINGHRPNQPQNGNVLLKDTFFLHDEMNRVFQLDQALFLADGFEPLRGADLRDNNDDGLVTDHIEYDALSRVVFESEDDGDSYSYSYDGANRVVSMADPLANAVTFFYDSNDNVIRIEQVDVSDTTSVPDQTFVTYRVFDQLDRLVRESDNDGHTSRYSYDSRDNLTVMTDAENNMVVADPLGLYPGDINQAGNSTRYAYDGRDLRVSEIQDLREGGTGAGVIDTSNASNSDGAVSVRYAYDLNERLTSTTDDNGNQTEYAYDALDRMVLQTNADATELIMQYDRDGNLIQINDPNGSQIVNTYDGLNRLIQRDINRGNNVVGTTLEIYSYDGLSRLTSSVDDNGDAPDHQIDRFYDSLDRKIEEQQDFDPHSNVFSGDGRRLQLSYPTSRNLDFEHDALNRVTEVVEEFPGRGPIQALVISDTKWIGPGICSEICPCDARPLLIAMGNGTEMRLTDEDLTEDQGYSSVREPVAMRHFDSGVAFVDRTYDYNRESLRVGETLFDVAGAPEDSYVLDSAYRSSSTVTDAFGGEAFSQTVDYTLDGAGNRVIVEFSQDFGGEPIVFDHDYTVNAMNAYTAIDTGGGGGGGGRAHDPNGNLTDANGFLYFYDYRNRLVEVRRKSDNALRALYEYDVLNRRVQRTTFVMPTMTVDEERRYLYDRLHVIEEWAGDDDYNNNGPLATYVYGAGIDQPTQMSTSASAAVTGDFWFHRDVRNNVVAVTNQAGEVVERTRYDDFGSFSQSASIDNRLLFQGRRYDPETGFFYYRNRYYDPLAGRFLQRDPLWDPVNRGNRYTFLGNNPLNGLDPLGLKDDKSNAELAEDAAEGAGVLATIVGGITVAMEGAAAATVGKVAGVVGLTALAYNQVSKAMRNSIQLGVNLGQQILTKWQAEALARKGTLEKELKVLDDKLIDYRVRQWQLMDDKCAPGRDGRLRALSTLIRELKEDQMQHLADELDEVNSDLRSINRRLEAAEKKVRDPVPGIHGG